MSSWRGKAKQVYGLVRRGMASQGANGQKQNFRFVAPWGVAWPCLASLGGARRALVRQGFPWNINTR